MSDDPKFPSQLAERFQIRLPDGMRNLIREEAEKNGRSMNAEIIARLSESLDFEKKKREKVRILKNFDEKSLSDIDNIIDLTVDEIKRALKEKLDAEIFELKLKGSGNHTDKK